MSVLNQALLRELFVADDYWDVVDTHFRLPARILTMTLKAKKGWFARQVCPHCGGRRSVAADGGKMRLWRHIDGWCVKTIISCELPRVQCAGCHRFYLAKPAWEGVSRYFTKSFETFAFRLLEETTVRGASRVLCESDRRLWRMLYSHVEKTGGKRCQTAIKILHREWDRTLA